ncbi:MAG: hypothetical protein EAZ92_02900 [Candidatus Kapaibacterium sp.]|nr:MAG: hypothetical protein EAZ92_02900 [Candidatus Kapabacteria bacterium]
MKHQQPHHSSLPNGWRWEKLGEIAKIVNGSTPDSGVAEYWNGEILWATPTDIGKLEGIYLQDTQRKISAKGYENCSTHIVPTGTILLTSRAPVGNIALTSAEMCFNQGIKGILPKDNIHNLYLFFALKSIVPAIQNASHGNTFSEIPTEKLIKFLLPLPPTLAEQHEIAERVRQRLEEAERIRRAAARQLEAVSALAGAIVREAFPFHHDLTEPT